MQIFDLKKYDFRVDETHNGEVLSIHIISLTGETPFRHPRDPSRYSRGYIVKLDDESWAHLPFLDDNQIRKEFLYGLHPHHSKAEKNIQNLGKLQ